MVVDDGCHLRGRQIRIFEIADELAMLFSRQGIGEESVTAVRRQEDHGIAQVDHRHSSTTVQPSAMTQGCKHRHLSTGRAERFGRRRHALPSSTW